MNKGVPQGSTLSPHLFNIFIDDLIREIDGTNTNKSVWAFADDIGFGFTSQEEYDNRMDIANKWCEINNAILNKEKCDVLVINNKKIKTELPQRKEIRYLGLHFNTKLSINKHYNTCKKKIDYICSRITMVSSENVAPTRMIQLFYVLMKSVIDYGSTIYLQIKAKTTLEKFKCLIRSTFKRTLRLKQSTPNSVVYQIIGEPEIEWYRRRMRITIQPDELRDNFTWNMLNNQRKERQKMRKKLTWVVILIASIPRGLSRKCKLCGSDHKFIHIRTHIDEVLQSTIDEIDYAIKEENSLSLLILIDKEKMSTIWKIYINMFIQTNTKIQKNEFESNDN